MRLVTAFGESVCSREKSRGRSQGVAFADSLSNRDRLAPLRRRYANIGLRRTWSCSPPTKRATSRSLAELCHNDWFANILCSSKAKMSALSKVEMSVSAPFWEFGGCHFDGHGGDEQARAEPS